MIAITDHDTAAGVDEAVAAAGEHPLAVVPGIEISTCTSPHELHVLGYWIDPRAPAIIAHQTAAAVRRVRRMERMVEKLVGMGVPVSMEEVRTAAGPEARTLGRPHLARALLAAGFIRSFSEAFNRYIGDRGPAFVAQDFPTPRDAIDAIHASGGVAVWAHPPLEVAEELMPSFADWGLDGVECFRPNTTPPDAERLQNLAERYDLFPSGGSDWHGPRRAFELGSFQVPAERIARLLAVGGITA